MLERDKCIQRMGEMMKRGNEEKCIHCMSPLEGISYNMALSAPSEEDIVIGPLCDGCRAVATKNMLDLFPSMRERGFRVSREDEKGKLFERIVEVDEDGQIIPGRVHRLQ